ncbi:hypothetical protein CgunFtcFv8_012584 [Champsocephalus gunnari]|uniref:Uncharacterized protein n=1 Tax=Champsocephalus gunnari TaxID=52237 RepID=A0AAN8DVI7_CHAGU|nr:hypothetical protein CgunFtcFv8_012584 [Champsocephalus gunnari]
MFSPGSARSARQRQRGFGVSEGRIDRKRKSESSSRRRTNPEFTSSPFRRPVNGLTLSTRPSQREEASMGGF